MDSFEEQMASVFTHHPSDPYRQLIGSTQDEKDKSEDECLPLYHTCQHLGPLTTIDEDESIPDVISPSNLSSSSPCSQRLRRPNKETSLPVPPQQSSSILPIVAFTENHPAAYCPQDLSSGLGSHPRRVWVEHPTLGYAPGTIVKSLNAGQILVAVEGDDQSPSTTVTMQLSESIPVHPSCLQGVPDLLALGEFDLGPLLHNIRVRYHQNEIYTSIGGPIMVSVNPYKPIPKLYSVQTANRYRLVGQRGSSDGDNQLPPHPFLLAQIALSNIFHRQLTDQSIIISGESGAGKTEATKIILGYLAGGDQGFDMHALGRGVRDRDKYPDTNSVYACNPQKNDNDGSTPRSLSVERQITRSNPVLEAFGNAKTLRNDNSSRFGKFIKIFFDTSSQKLISAKICNYLLEKSRIVTQQEDERNYHIFYQLCCGRSLLDPQLQERLSLQDPENFDYLNRCTLVSGLDDYQEFVEVLECLNELGFRPEELEELWSLLAGILYFGNVNLKTTNNTVQEAVVEIENAEPFKRASELLGVPEEQLFELLTTASIQDPQTRKAIKKRRTVEEVLVVRDALCKCIYERLFQWIIGRINDQLKIAFENQDVKKRARRMTEPTERKRWRETPAKIMQHNQKSIGLLDIYGFEVFETNSFEQLCINFANEQLQQHFNSHIFREEQALYVKENIDWTQIKFEDNQHIIQALTHKGEGVFPTLDSECLIPKATDKTFLNKMLGLTYTSKVIIKPPILKQDSQFGINHYAGPVYYSTDGMLDKNRDRVHRDVFEVFDNHGRKLLREMFSDSPAFGPDASSSKQLGSNARPTRSYSVDSPKGFAHATVSFRFRNQLSELSLVLKRTSASYIRCIKPNSEKAALSFESVDILRQLKYAGLLESIRIRKAGYPIRLDLLAFLTRYRVLLNPTQLNSLSKCKQHPDPAAVRRLVEELLNWIVSHWLPTTASGSSHTGSGNDFTSVSDTERPWQVGTTKIFMKEKLQAEAERLRVLAREKCATEISRRWKGHYAKVTYRALRQSCYDLQAHSRMTLTRWQLQSYMERRSSVATRLQAAWKGCRERREWRAMLIAVLRIQSAWREYRMKMRLQLSVADSPRHRWREQPASLLVDPLSESSGPTTEEGHKNNRIIGSFTHGGQAKTPRPLTSLLRIDKKKTSSGKGTGREPSSVPRSNVDRLKDARRQDNNAMARAPKRGKGMERKCFSQVRLDNTTLQSDVQWIAEQREQHATASLYVSSPLVTSLASQRQVQEETLEKLNAKVVGLEYLLQQNHSDLEEANLKRMCEHLKQTLTPLMEQLQGERLQEQLQKKSLECERLQEQLQRKCLECERLQEQLQRKSLEYDRLQKQLQRKSPECEQLEENLQKTSLECKQLQNQLQLKSLECEQKEKEVEQLKLDLIAQEGNEDNLQDTIKQYKNELEQIKGAYADLNKEVSFLRQKPKTIPWEENPTNNASCGLSQRNYYNEFLSARFYPNSRENGMSFVRFYPNGHETDQSYDSSQRSQSRHAMRRSTDQESSVTVRSVDGCSVCGSVRKSINDRDFNEGRNFLPRGKIKN